MNLDLSQIERRYLALLALRWLPVGFIAPLLVLILTRELTLTRVGPLLAIYGITTAILELPTGGLADTIGRRPVLAASSLAGVGMFGILLLSSSFVWLGLGLFLGGISRALDSGPLQSWFVDTSRLIDPEVDLRPGLSRGGATDGIVLALGAIAGGILPQVFGGRLLVSVWCAFVAQILHFVGVLNLMKEPPLATDRGVANALAAVPEAVRGGIALGSGSRPVRRLLLTGMTLGIFLVGIEILWQPRFVGLLGGDQATSFLGFLLAAAFVGTAIGSSLAPRLGAFIERRMAAPTTVAQAAAALAMVALAASSWVPAAMFFFVLAYTLLGMVSPLRIELLHENVPAERRATMLSADSLVLQTGGFLAALTLPALADSQGIPAAWYLGALVLGAGALLYIGVTGRAHHPDS